MHNRQFSIISDPLHNLNPHCAIKKYPGDGNDIKFRLFSVAQSSFVTLIPSPTTLGVSCDIVLTRAKIEWQQKLRKIIDLLIFLCHFYFTLPSPFPLSLEDYSSTIGRTGNWSESIPFFYFPSWGDLGKCRESGSTLCESLLWENPISGLMTNFIFQFFFAHQEILEKLKIQLKLDKLRRESRWPTAQGLK